MGFDSFRERFNLLIYENKAFTLKALKFVSVFFSLGMLGSMIYYYGFPIDDQDKLLIIQWMKASFVFYIASYFIRIIYSFEVKTFLKKNWLEGVLFSILIINATGDFLFNYPIAIKLFTYLGILNFDDYYNVFIQLYLLIVVGLDLFSVTGKFQRIKINPAIIFIGIFIGLILLGAGALCLPEMTTANGSMRFLDALFTSTSATCVTGLIVEDTATFFTFKGHIVLLSLIKIGGMNILAFGMFFALVSKFGISLKQHDVIEDFINNNSINNSKNLLTKILLISIVIELSGAFALFFTLPECDEILSIGDRVFHSVFHSVSAFNNAGISLYTNSFYEDHLQTSYITHLVLAGLIFLGALGFTTILELISPSEMRDRLRLPWKKMHISSRIAIKSSFHLTIFGAVLFLFLERDNSTLSDLGTVEKFITSFFQSVTTRTAGFNTVDFSQLGIPILLVFLLLMFIGGSSSSTAGGIKTSTFTLLMVAAWSTIRGKRNTELFQKNLSYSLLEKAFSILLFSLACLLVSVFVLSITESAALEDGSIRFIDIIFEEVSAFSTVGLSTGITSQLSDPGRLVIIFSMFVGRIGTLTLAFALSKAIISKDYKYPDAHMMVG